MKTKEIEQTCWGEESLVGSCEYRNDSVTGEGGTPEYPST